MDLQYIEYYFDGYVMRMVTMVIFYREEVKQGLLAGPSIYAAALIDTIPQDWEGKIYNYVVH